MIGLILLHGLLSLNIPLTAGRAAQVFFFNQRGLDLSGSTGIDRSLPVYDVGASSAVQFRRKDARMSRFVMSGGSERRAQCEDRRQQIYRAGSDGMHADPLHLGIAAFKLIFRDLDCNREGAGGGVFPPPVTVTIRPERRPLRAAFLPDKCHPPEDSGNRPLGRLRLDPISVQRREIGTGLWR